MGNQCCVYEKPPEAKDVYFDDFVATLPNMNGKTVAITGTTTGVGLSCAKVCAKLGATVLMLNRESERVAKAIESVRDSVESAGLTWSEEMVVP